MTPQVTPQAQKLTTQESQTILWQKGANLPAANQQENRLVRVEVGKAYTIPTSVKRIEIISGLGWISYEGVDILLPAGERFSIYKPRFPLTISPLDGTALVMRLIV